MTERAAESYIFPRRVLIINPVAELGGAERVLLDFIESTRAFKPDLAFHVLTLAEGPLTAAVQHLGVTASVLPLPKSLQALGDSASVNDAKGWSRARLLGSLSASVPALVGFVRALRSEIINRSPDIVHSNGIKAHLLAGLATPFGLPLIWHIHDFIGERPFAGSLMRPLASRASAAIAISQAVARDIVRTLPSLRVVTILNAVDIDEFSPGLGDGEWLDRLAGMSVAPPETLRVGLVATYARWKGQDVFLRAAAAVRRSSPNKPVRFYIVGGPLYATEGAQYTERELRDLIAQFRITDVASLVPFQASLPPVLRSLDIVVHCSTRPEPFGRSILEAMACARPTVVTGDGGIREVVRPGTTGLVYSRGDALGLASAIEELMNSPSLRSSFGNAAAVHARRDFGHARLGPSLFHLYQTLQTQRNGTNRLPD